MIALERDEVLLVGFSVNVLGQLGDDVPAGSVLVVEEPDLIAARNLERMSLEFPAVSSVIACAYQDLAQLRRLLNEEPRLKSARAVVPGVEYAVTPAAVLAETLGLAGAGLRAGSVFRDKYELRLLARSAGLGNPEFALVSGPADVAAFMGRAGGPCVLKPTGSQASLGVQILDDPAQAEAAWELSVATSDVAAPSRGIASRMLVETVVTGPEYSVEMLVFKGEPCFVNVTAKQVLPGRFPVEIGHVVPAPALPALRGLLAASTSELARQVGFDFGVLHCEWIVHDGACVLIECAARMPGDQIPELIARAYGFGFMTDYLRCLLGERPLCPARAGRGAAIRFLSAPAGRVLRVEGPEAAGAQCGIEVVSVDVKPGHQVAAPTSSWDRPGYVIATGDTPEAAQAAAEAACRGIHIEVAPR